MKIGIALSGGGMRGIAHAGVLQALEEKNISIDVIGGTSAGSMIATLYALGYTPKEILQLFQKYAKKIAGRGKFFFVPSILNSKDKTGLRDGKDLEEIYNHIAKQKGIENISQIKMPLVIPCVDIKDAKEYIFTNYVPKGEYFHYISDISIGKAVRASSSFPAVFNPCHMEEHAFMDGGAVDNIPVKEVKKQGADTVIAVKFNADPINEKSTMIDIIMKTIDIMGNRIAEQELQYSDYILNIETEKMGLLDTNRLESCFKEGYDAVMNHWETIQEIIKRNEKQEL